MSMTIQVDDREGNRIHFAKDYYRKHKVKIKHLNTGDYIFNNKIVFEYKKINDFVNSITTKRIYRQVERQKNEYPHHFVIVEGKEGELKKITRYTRYNYRQLHHILYGGICRLNTITTVLTAPTMPTAFYMMQKQAEKILDNKVHTTINHKKTNNTAEKYLSCIDGIGGNKAHQICNDLQLSKLSDLINMTLEDLTSLKGIGNKTAVKILDNIT